MFNGLYNSFLGAPVREVKEEYGKLKESLGSRQAEMDNAWENSSMLGGLASTAKNVTGAFGDVGGSVVSALVPDRVTEPRGSSGICR